jgi:hypothetical protein
VSVSVCGALGRNISKVAAGGAVLSGSSCTAKLWNEERERERERDVPIPSKAIKGQSRAIMRNHAQSRAIQSNPEPSRAIQSHPEQSPVEGIEGHRGSGWLGGPKAAHHGAFGEIVGARRRFRCEEERHACMHLLPQSDQQGSYLVRVHLPR